MVGRQIQKEQETTLGDAADEHNSMPTGLYPSAQGCEELATLGNGLQNSVNPEWVVALGGRVARAGGATPLAFRADDAPGGFPSVEPASQRWADRRNPVGIQKRTLGASIIGISWRSLLARIGSLCVRGGRRRAKRWRARTTAPPAPCGFVYGLGARQQARSHPRVQREGPRCARVRL